jgi:peptidoglycan LD-endopeptidase LytH
MPMEKSLENVLKSFKENFSPVVPFDLNKENLFIFDFTESNKELAEIDLSNSKMFTDYIFGKLEANNTPAGIGKYAENRTIYRRSKVFEGDDGPRTYHLGIDIWAEAGTPIFAPMDSIIHSFKNNSSYGDYGPTIILVHEINGLKFFTLYGHLSLESLENIFKKKEIKKGEIIGTLGDPFINVQWPPHLHFQIIKDLMNNEGDFPGVASEAKKEFYLKNSPNPNLILNIEQLR